MRVIHCPRTEDPLTYARQFTARRAGGGLAGLLSGNGLIIGLVIVMVIGTFTIGPLRPKTPETPPETATAATQTQSAAPVVYVEPVMCQLPAGGMIQAGWETLIVDGDEVVQVRCMDDGTLQATATEF